MDTGPRPRAFPASKENLALLRQEIAVIYNMRTACGDLREALVRWHLIGTFAWQEVATRYRRSRVGVFWLTINSAIMIGAMGLVFTSLFGTNLRDFLPYLTLGLLLWNFISANINEGCLALSGAGGIILQTRLPIMTHIFQLLWKNLIILAHHLVIVPAVFLIFRVPLTPNAWWALPGFLLLLANLLWVMVILSVACARFRDLTQIVTNLVQVLFYLTPIFWMPEIVRARLDPELLLWNPFYCMIDLIRAPLLGETPPGSMWFLMSATAMCGWLVALWFYGRYFKRVSYWV